MRYDAQKRAYIDDNGKEIPPAVIRQRLDQYIKDEQERTKKKARLMLIGLITVAGFFEYMRQSIARWHTTAALLAYGGADQMTHDRFAPVQEKIESELAYLADFEKAVEASQQTAATIAKNVIEHVDLPPDIHAPALEKKVEEALQTAAPSEAPKAAADAINQVFETVQTPGAVNVTVTQPELLAPTVTEEQVAEAIPEGAADQLIGGTVTFRAGMYPDATWATHENILVQKALEEGDRIGRRVCEEDSESCLACMHAADEGFIFIGDIAPIGTLTCRGNCRCFIEMWRFNPDTTRDYPNAVYDEVA